MNVIILDPTSSLSFPKKHQTHNKDDPINKNEINSLHNFGAILEDHEHSTDDSQDITHQCDPPKIVNTAQSMFMLKPSSEYWEIKQPGKANNKERVLKYKWQYKYHLICYIMLGGVCLEKWILPIS